MKKRTILVILIIAFVFLLSLLIYGYVMAPEDEMAPPNGNGTEAQIAHSLSSNVIVYLLVIIVVLIIMTLKLGRDLS